jgi:hypothetical protein
MGLGRLRHHGDSAALGEASKSHDIAPERRHLESFKDDLDDQHGAGTETIHNLPAGNR